MTFNFLIPNLLIVVNYIYIYLGWIINPSKMLVFKKKLVIQHDIQVIFKAL